MTVTNKIKDLLMLLADLYAAEGRPTGDKTSIALRLAAHDCPANWPIVENPKPGLAETALQIDPLPEARVIYDALPFIQWFDPGECIANLKADRAAKMLACELLGPDGMMKHPDIRVGLYVQEPDFDYASHAHAAQETYIALGGVGYWGVNYEKPNRRITGDVMYHPTMITHQNLTKADPMIATWRWSGDISFDNYYTS